MCKPPEPNYTFGPRQKKTLTFSAQTHGFSIFPEVFETFFRFSTWKWGDPTQRQINSCTCLPARAVATSSVSSYSTSNCMQSAKKSTTGNCRALPRFHAHIRDTEGLTFVAVEFGGVDPVAPRLSQHYFWTRQGSPLRNSRHYCGAFSPLDLLLLLQLLPGRSALLPPDVILGPFRHSFRYNVTTQESS